MATAPSIGRAAPEARVATPAAVESTRTLYERYSRQIFAHCLVQLRNREEAEDAVQITFMNAFRALERGVVPELESAWLYKIAGHVCLTRQRSWSRRRQVESPDDFENVQELFGAPVHEPGEVIGIADALRELPEQQRRAILLREWQGLTYKEIANEMQVSQASVETLIFRARRGLAQRLEKLRASGDIGSIFAAAKSILFGLGTKAAVTIVTVATTSVVAATPEARHQVIHIVDAVSNVTSAPRKSDRPAREATKPRRASAPVTLHSHALHRIAAVATARAAAPATASKAKSFVAKRPTPTDSPPAVEADAQPPKSEPAPAVPIPVPVPVKTAAPATSAPSGDSTKGTPPAASTTTPAATTGDGPAVNSAATSPSLGGFSPSSGAPGTVVQLSGKGFSGATAVRFYGTNADYTVNSDTSITTRVPSGATSGPITVVTPGSGNVTTSASFTVAASTTPAINGTSPASGGVGATVGIGGKNLSGATSVKFNGTSADFTVNSDGLIMTHVPAGATSGPITVVTPSGSVSSSSSFTVTAGAPPTIGGISPSGGTAGTTVVIGGTHFTGATAVRFNGTSADFTVNSETSITTRVPSGATTGAIAVITPNGATTSGTFTVTVAATPAIEGFTPGSAQPGATVTIGGKNLTGATSVKFNGLAASFTVSSDTTISATVPSGATSGTISVTTPNGSATSSATFTVTTSAAPSISGFSPPSGAVGASVGIAGARFTGATSVRFNGTAASFSVNSEGVIMAVVPAGATTGTVTVTTPAGTATSTGNFTVTSGH